MVMTAHILNPSFDPKYPATLSKATLDFLRNELSYAGLIISDDLEMKAITDHFGVEEAPRLAIEAGCDLLIYRSEGATRKAYASLLKALDEGKLNPQRVIDSAERSQQYKEDFIVPYEPVFESEARKVIDTPEHKELLSAFSG
jgi:beta-N-acetylhexosaminidase